MESLLIQFLIITFLSKGIVTDQNTDSIENKSYYTNNKIYAKNLGQSSQKIDLRKGQIRTNDDRLKDSDVTEKDQEKDHPVVYNEELSEHAMVTDSEVFPYMVSILKETQYLSSGALIDQSWVLTAADGLFLLNEAIRLLRIRVGSINYKKGGILIPVKLLEIHPYFDDRKPNYDLALVMLAKPVRYTPNIKAIRIQLTPREVTATHFIVTSWPGPLSNQQSEFKVLHIKTMDAIKRHRMLTVTHLHPSEPEDCTEELKAIEALDEGIMCLDPAIKDACMRDTGAPVVLNHVLWAVVSSWKPDDCEEYSGGPVFATLLSARNVSTWIHATVHGHRWKET